MRTEIPQGYQLPEHLPTDKMVPRDYQNWAFKCITDHIRNYTGPAFVNAATGAGKSLLIAMVGARCQQVGIPCLMLARQGELVQQNADEMWKCRVDNSIYSASLGRKSTAFSTICASEGTFNRALNTELASQRPAVLLLDECHHLDINDCLEDDPKTQFGQTVKELLRRNPNMRIIGFTGSPFRGTESILGEFWKGGQLCDISTDYLTKRGYLVPTSFGFGHDDIKYDLSEWQSSGGQGAQEFTSKELTAMQRKISKLKTTTHKIIAEVVELSKDRGGVLITCAGKKHCEEAAEILPGGSFAIITDSTSTRDRKAALDAARAGEIKYVFQVGCLTTGVNVPIWDVVVILRKIGSLTLLIQLIGRGLRPYLDGDAAAEYFSTEGHENDKRLSILAGSSKPDCLVLDYSDTMEELGGLYHDPILEEAQAKKASFDLETISCPVCRTQNSKYARRCIGTKPPHVVEQMRESGELIDERCEFFFTGVMCGEKMARPGCGTMNDPAARECRKCGQQQIDPNQNLKGKHYTDADLVDVNKMDIRPTRSGEGVVITYNTTHASDPVATEVFHPFHQQTWMRGAWAGFIKKHINGAEWRKRAHSLRSVSAIVKNKAMFDVPAMITHRRNEKGKSIVGRKVFRSGREEKEG